MRTNTKWNNEWESKVATTGAESMLSGKIGRRLGPTSGKWKTQWQQVETRCVTLTQDQQQKNIANSKHVEKKNKSRGTDKLHSWQRSTGIRTRSDLSEKQGEMNSTKWDAKTQFFNWNPQNITAQIKEVTALPLDYWKQK
jgi:hypothetical protein